MKLCVANWKMHKTTSQAREFVRVFTANKTKYSVIICPPFTGIEAVGAATKGKKIGLGAQNLFFEEEGPYTGEISAAMLVDLGVTHVIVGHSERRRLFGETNNIINKKIHATLKHKLIPILCIGENLGEKESGKTMEVIKIQLAESLHGVSGKVIVAYEPVWSIGTGKQPSILEIEQVHTYIKELHAVKTVLYGGSVNPENAKMILPLKSVDGVLVGGSSVDVKEFLQICNT